MAPTIVITKPRHVCLRDEVHKNDSSVNSTNSATISRQNITKARHESLLAKWTWAGRGEHASIASFNTFSLQLVALGAPLELLRKAQQAALEEVEHARLSFEVASHYYGLLLNSNEASDNEDCTSLTRFSIQPTALTERADILIDPEDVETVAVATTSEGCVDEMTSVLVTAIELAASIDPSIVDYSTELYLDHYAPAEKVRRVVVRDESRHAALAWQTVRWIVNRDHATDTDAMSQRDSIRSAIVQTLNRELPGALEQLRTALSSAGGVQPERSARFLETATSLWSWLAFQCDIPLESLSTNAVRDVESSSRFVVSLRAQVSSSVEHSFERETYGAMLQIVEAFLEQV